MATNQEICQECDGPIAAVLFRDKTGAAYCLECAETFDKCETCGEPVTPNEACYRDAEGVIWHKECD